MKKNISYLFLFLFSFFSFFVTIKTTAFIKQADVIWQHIEENEDDYNIEQVDGIILDDMFIPGTNGLKVDVNKSYNNMKRIGFFNDKLLIYEDVKNNNLLIDNLDKYIISGSKNKHAVSILLYINNNTQMDVIKSIDYPINLIVSYDYYLDNKDLLDDLTNKKNNILINNISSKDIKNIKLNQKNGYCFFKDKDNDFKKLCATYNYYSILDHSIINKNYLFNIKKNLENGKIFSLNGSYEKELKTIFNYINLKGYEILSLDELLKENIK